MIIPCRNEEGFIAECLECALATEYPKDKFEIIVADGRSTDNTIAIIRAFVQRDSRIVLVDNSRRSTPFGLNMALRRSTGEVVMLMGAHSKFPPDYVSVLIRALEDSQADATGGACRTLPADSSPRSEAIALGMSHPFGVGNSHFRIGSKQARWVDTVAFGCYRRDVFCRIGEFDTELPRNQDDEFNLRLLRAGGRMLLVPTVESEYVARSSLKKLGRMYFQYGFYKPLVARKVGGFVTLRQLVPGTFVLSLAILLALSPWVVLGRTLMLVEVATYLLAACLAISKVARSTRATTCVWLLPVFLTLHVSYGLGFLQGCFRFYLRGAGASFTPVDVPLSR